MLLILAFVLIVCNFLLRLFTEGAYVGLSLSRTDMFFPPSDFQDAFIAVNPDELIFSEINFFSKHKINNPFSMLLQFGGDDYTNTYFFEPVVS